MIGNGLITYLTYPLFLFFIATGRVRGKKLKGTEILNNNPTELKSDIPRYNLEELKPAIIADFKKVLVFLKSGTLSDSDENFITNLVNTAMLTSKIVIPPYFSNELFSYWLTKCSTPISTSFMTGTVILYILMIALGNTSPFPPF